MKLLIPLQVCPVAPGGAQTYVDQITGNVLWGVQWIFVIALVISIAAIAAGRLFMMPHASRVGVISTVVVFLSAIAYLTLPSLLDALMGKGCI
jgi:hypothetical protein